MARVARRVELKDIRLLEIKASGAPRSTGILRPFVTHECEGKLHSPTLIEVVCRYRFTATQGEIQAVEATLSYVILYDLAGADPIPEHDLREFAFANGTYHSWPFARQLLFDVTSRLGYLPYSLPVFKFIQRPRPEAPTEKLKVEPSQSPPATESSKRRRTKRPQSS